MPKRKFRTLEDMPWDDYSDERWFGEKILWFCSNPNYGQSEPDIRKGCMISKRITDERLRTMMYLFKDLGWVRLKLDDDDGYYWTTNRGIVAYRETVGGEKLKLA